jgi:hypothetical protein
MLWLKPSSMPNYSSNRHLNFSCMLSIMEYSNKLNMILLSPGSSHFRIIYTWQNYYKVNTMLILLNKPYKLWMRINSNPWHMLNKHLQFSCMLSIMEYSSKLNMKSLTPDNTRYCKRYMFKHHCIINTVLIFLNSWYKLWMQINSNLWHMLNKHLQFDCTYYSLWYSNKSGTRWKMPGNIHYCRKCTLKHQCITNTVVIIILNKRHKLWMPINSNPGDMLNKH